MKTTPSVSSHSALILAGSIAALLLTPQASATNVEDWSFLDANDHAGDWGYNRTYAFTDAGVLLGATPPPNSDHGAYVGMMEAHPTGLNFGGSGVELQFYAPDSQQAPTEAYELLTVLHQETDTTGRQGFSVGTPNSTLNGDFLTKQINEDDVSWTPLNSNGLVGAHTLAVVSVGGGTVQTYVDGSLVNTRTGTTITDTLDWIGIGNNSVNGNWYWPFSSVISRVRTFTVVSGASGDVNPNLLPVTTWTGGIGEWTDAGTPWSRHGSAVTWTNGSDVIFGKGNDAGGDVTVNGTVLPQSIAFNNTGSGTYVIVPGTNALIDFGGATRLITVAENASAEIAVEITNGKVVKSGDGMLTLAGTNTYSGGTSLVQGTLQMTNAASLGPAGNISFQGGTLKYGTGLNTDVSGRINPIASGQLVKINTNGNDVDFTTGISGDGGLTKYGSGILTLAAANTYAGVTTVTAGGLVLTAGTTSTLNVLGGTATVNNGAGATTTNVSGGHLALDGSVSGTLTITGGSATIGAVSSVGTAAISGGSVNAIMPLTIGNTLKVPGANAAGTTAFTVSGSNIANDTQTGASARTLTLGGGTLSFTSVTAIGTASYTTANDYTFSAAANNRIAGLSPGAYSNGAEGAEGTGPVTKLTDGLITTDYADTYTMGDNVTLTYTLGGVAPLGYDLSTINIYSGWGDGGRKNITLDNISISTVGSPLVFTSIAGSAVDYDGGTDKELASLTATGGFLASGVYAVRFNFGPQQNGYVGYRELEVVGTLTAPPGPINFANTNIAATASSTLNLGGATLNHTLGKVILSNLGTVLTLSGAQSVTFSGTSEIPVGTTLDVNGVNVTLVGISDGAGTVANEGTSDAVLTVEVADTETAIVSGTITDGATNKISVVKTGLGTLNLDNAVQNYDSLTASAGTTNVNGVLGTLPGVADVTVANGAALKFGSVSQTLSSLTIGAGATVVFTSGPASGGFSGGAGKSVNLGGSTTVPEPGTLGLLLVGALGVLNRRRRNV